MLVALFAEPLQRRYEAPRWSCAHLFAILTTILAIVLPFFLCYPSSWEGGSIWLKQDKYREQPDVQYLYKFVIRLQLTDKLGVPKEIFYSTMNSANAVRMDSVRMAAVKSIEIDDDLDGLMDRFRLTSLIPLELGEAVYGLQVRVPCFFDGVINYTLPFLGNTIIYFLLIPFFKSILISLKYLNKGSRHFPLSVKESRQN